MKHLGLFEGIGGFSYAAKLMGWETVAWCEINEFCQTVLSYHFPNATGHSDIKTTDFKQYANKIDIITGGFPCQPYSQAGKRLGKEDERHLWPEMLRAIREIKPTWVVGENVRGLVNWSGGLVFEEVCADLENIGYEVQPFILPACAVNAPHRRDRVWFIAYSNSNGQNRSNGENEINPGKRRINAQRNTIKSFEHGTTSDTDGKRLWRESNRFGKSRLIDETSQINDWDNFPTEPPLHRRDDGLPKRLANFVVDEVHYEISKTSKENRIENLQEVWQRVQQEEIWEQIRGLYSLDSKDLLFQTMQLYSTGTKIKKHLSPFSQEVSKEPLRTLRKYGEFRSSPQGQKLEKQRFEQFGNTLSFLPHEVALAAKAYTDSIRKFETWHRQESIKAYGNAVVPQVVLQIFKAIEQYEIQRMETNTGTN